MTTVSSEAAEQIDADLARSDGSEYVLGPSTYRKLPRLETKPDAGYERFRSYEITPGKQEYRKRDVYVYAHRLLALVHPDVVDLPIGDALEYLDGRDVHHKNSIKFDNRLDNLELLDHARHASITQSELRDLTKAAAADAKREQEAETEDRLGADRCPGCGTETETLATSPGFEGERCLECAMMEADGAEIQL